jgi:SnoaL-like domain
MSATEQIQALERKIEQLTHELGVLQDVHAIRRLQHTYGYYIDKCLYDEVVDLFAEDSETRFLGGVFCGKAGARRLYGGVFRNKFAQGRNGPAHGQLLEHLTLQDVIDVAADRNSARGRFRCFMQGGSHDSARDQVPQFWEGGVYENAYIREGGVWRIKALHYNPLFNCNYESGWAHTAPGYAVPLYTVTFPQDPLGPDRLTPQPPSIWPENRVVPFHYPHPVTGRPVE